MAGDHGGSSPQRPRRGGRGPPGLRPTPTAPGGGVTPTPGVPDVLARSREVVMPSMEKAIDRLAPDIRRLASYHLGWTDTEGRPIGAPGGKGIRPTLALLSAE